MTKFKILIGTSAAALLSLLIISVFFPVVLLFSLPITVPVSAFLILRIKPYFSVPAIYLTIILGLIFRFNYLFLSAAIVFTFACAGAVFAFRFKTFEKNVLTTAIFVMVGIAIVFSGFFVLTNSSPADAIPNKIEQSTDSELISVARESYIAYWKQENINRPKAEFDKKYEEFIGTMTDSDALKFLASDVRWFLYKNISLIMMGALVLISLCSSIISTGLSPLFQNNFDKESKLFNTNKLSFQSGFNSKIPSGYFLPVFITVLIFMFFGKFYPVCGVIYRTFMFSFWFIPFSIFGIMACLSVIIKSKNPIILLIIAFMIILIKENFFMYVGIIDYALKKFDILEINDD